MARLVVLRRIALAAAILLPGSAAAIPEPDPFFGPPSYSLMGCSYAAEWTPSYVRSATGLTERQLQRAEQKFGFTPERICAAEPDVVRGMVAPTKARPMRYDQPKDYLEFRRMQLVDTDGEIPLGAFSNAVSQRQTIMEPPPGLKIGGEKSTQITEKAAGISPGSWTWLGPGNIGGRVRAISPDPTTPGRILVGGVAGGVWLTTSGGTGANAWTAIDDFLPSLAISCLVRDPANANTVYACTGEGFFNSDAVRGRGVYKSTNGGNSWSQVSSTDPDGGASTDWYYVNRLAISPTNSQVMLAATNGGVYRTTNGGTSWTKVYGDLGNGRFRRVLDVQFHPTDGTKALLGEGNHCTLMSPCTNAASAVAYSSDGGAGWTRVPLSTSAVSTYLGRTEIAWSKSDPSIVYAVVDLADGQLFKSTDGGVTWTLNAPVSTPAHLGGQGWYNNTVWVAPNDPNRVIVGGLSLKMSLNGGSTWTTIGGGVHVDHHAIVSDPSYNSNFTIYGGNDGGVYKATGVNTATPGASTPAWTSLNNGLGVTQFYGGAGKAGGRITGGTQDNGTLLWTGTTNWTRIWGSDGGDSAADQGDGNYVYGMTQYGGIVRYTQALAATPPANASQYICTGISDASCNFNNPAPKILFIPPMAIDPIGNTTLFLGANSLWRSTNIKDAVNTTVAWSAVRGPVSASSYISAIAIAPGNSNLMWIGYHNGALACTQNALAASPSWTVVTGPPGATSRYVTRISFDPSNTNRVFVSYAGYQVAGSTGVNLHTTSAGCGAPPSASPPWTNIHNQLPLAPIRSVAVHPNNPAWLYAGTEVGIFTSTNNGANWSASNEGPGVISVEELFFLDNTTLVAATHGRGMFTTQALPGSAPAFTSSPPANGTVGVAYAHSYTASGSPAPTFSLTAGSFPPGLTLNGTTGVLSGTPNTNGSYNGTVTATNTSGTATQDFMITTGGGGVTVPGAPTIDTATPGNGQATVAFTPPASNGGAAITSYTVTCGAFSNVGAASPITVSGLTNGTSYSCSVTATNSAGTGAASGTLSVTPATVPGAPTIGTATPGNNQATVSFTPPASNGGSAITGYTVLCGALSATGAASPITVTGLTNGASVNCTVRATNAVGSGSPSGVVSVTPAGTPGAPTIGTATPGNGQATVSFTPPASNGGSAITSYTATCGAFSASAAASPITVTGLTNGTTYSCSVTATNSAGTGAASGSASVTPATVPGAPTIGTATPGNNQAAVSFTPPASNGGAAITSYTATCGAFSASGAASPITVTGLTNGTSYSCSVKATNSVGAGPSSGTANVTPVGPPGAPTIGTATPGNGQLTVSFTPPASNGGAAITSYTMSCGAFSASGAASPITVTGLTNGTSYLCSVTATNSAGTGTASGSVSATPVGPPGAPTIGTATPGDSQAAVSFTPPASNGGAAITSYTATCGAFSASGAASPITVTGLTNGTTYSCSVKATNSAGTGPASGTASVTPAAAVVPPGAPTIGTATPGNGQAAISFSPPASNGGAAITSYTATCGAFSASGAASPITVTGLTNGTTYSCSVKATNSAGTGAASGSVSVTPATVPGAPTIGTATPASGQATVSFTPPASNGGAAITSYTATCGAFSASGAGSPITVTGLTNGTTYSCSVKATNSAGTGAASGSVNVTPIGPPTAPTLGSAIPGNGQATVSFSAPASNGGSAITGYTASCGAFSASGATSPITVTGLSNGTTYLCSVAATNAVGTGPSSGTASVTPATVPGAPTIGTATPGNNQATVSFTPPASNGGAAITSYTASCGAFSASGAASPITVTGLSNGTTYGCAVTATNSAGTGPASGTANVTPASGVVLALVGVSSRKNHPVGGNLDLAINTAQPIGGAVTVESRVGPTHKIVFSFNDGIFASGTATCVDASALPVGSVSVAAVGSTVEVTLTGIPDAKRVTVSLTGVNGTLNASASVGFLVGDVNNNYMVTSSDILLINGRIGQAANASNFRYDVNVSGNISQQDVNAAKANSGQILP